MRLMDSVPCVPTTATARALHWRRLLIPAVLVLVAGVLVCVVAVMKPTETPPPPPQIVPVNVETVRVQPLPELADAFVLTAIVEPNRIVKVAAEVAGRIERYGERTRDVTWHGRQFPRGSMLDEGQPVWAGDLLVCLNKDLLQARYDRAAAQFESDEREYLRILVLFERGTTSKTELDDARTRRDISKAGLDEAARALERTAIAAPISGILNRLPMELGEYASAGDQVAEIVEMDPVKVVGDVPERDVPYLKVGDRAEISPLADLATPIAGVITYRCALADEGTRTTRIEITVDNRDDRLHSGEIVKLHLTRRVLADVIMIPLASVIPLEEGKIVYVVHDGRAERRDVELGFIKGRDVRVVSGLQAGDALIVTGQRFVGSGQSVTVAPQ